MFGGLHPKPSIHSKFVSSPEEKYGERNSLRKGTGSVYYNPWGKGKEGGPLFFQAGDLLVDVGGLFRGVSLPIDDGFF